MSEDEVIATIASTALAIATWGALFVALMRRSPLYRSVHLRLTLAGVGVFAIAAMFALLKAFAASDVRDDPKYLYMYTAMGAAWAGLLRWILGITVGVRARDDVAERANPAATLVQAGLILGAMLAFAGGNFGDGPGWWVVVPSAALATASLVAAWYLVELVGRLSHLVTIERDTATGLRAAAMLISCGAIFGRAVAGDWLGYANLFTDFGRLAWPALLIVAAEVFAQLLLRPTTDAPRPALALAGFPLAILYIMIATGSIVLMGWW
ncbi:MAG: hypothetical protein R3B68_01455 [Phycisphaerales bacterium]